VATAITRSGRCPGFSPAGGTYTAAQTVTLSSTTSGRTIRYTTDGSAPNEPRSGLYGAVHGERHDPVKAMACHG